MTMTWRKTKTGHALYQGDKGKPLATIEPDYDYPGMWRIHTPDGWVSDLKNLAWAKDGAIRVVNAAQKASQTARNRVSRGSAAEDAPNLGGHLK
jgi:hypothetical protein